jgi:NAD(P)-dependent dehydrogenase (short-subunit alcohol dehydrogenase family)
MPTENPNLFIFGPTGNLGPTWVQTAIESGWNVIGLGLGRPDDSQNNLLLEYFELDLTNFDQSELMDVFSKYRPSAILFNSGIDSPPGLGKQKIQDFDSDSWERVFQVNLFGFIRIMNVFLRNPDKLKNVIVIGSMYASASPNFKLYSHFQNGSGSLKHPAYGASKAALKSVIEQYAATLAPHGIRLNMLSPGGVRGNQDLEFIKKFSDRTPISRLAEAHELKSSLRYLLDPENTYITGQNINVDGGYQLW